MVLLCYYVKLINAYGVFLTSFTAKLCMPRMFNASLTALVIYLSTLMPLLCTIKYYDSICAVICS